MEKGTAMSEKTENGGAVVTYGVSICVDGSEVSIYLGTAGSDESFEFVMPKGLAMQMSSTIQRLISPAGDPHGGKSIGKPRSP